MTGPVGARNRRSDTTPPSEAVGVSLHARTSTGWSAPAPSGAGAGAGDCAGGAHPALWLGAPALGGLMLPDAAPTPSQLYAPRGVWLDDERLVACDTGNHRVLIWHDPDALVSHAEADVVLGQPDFVTEGAQAGGRGPAKGMRLPTGVLVHEGCLVVADAWNHRILVWDEVPRSSDVAPDRVIGQADPVSVDENRGVGCSPIGLYWPFGVAMIDGRFWVADTGNRRVLAWNGIPERDEPPTVVLGQPDAASRDENRGELGPASFRWPHAIAGAADTFFVADAGNHRILGWRPPPSGDTEATTVLGQPDFTSAGEFPYQPQTASALRFPYAIDIGPVGDEAIMVVADTANNRILVWDELPAASRVPATRVLGQPDFATNGENRWDAVRDDTFCWPYGLSLHDGRVAVADSGNNRVMVWELA